MCAHRLVLFVQSNAHVLVANLQQLQAKVCAPVHLHLKLSVCHSEDSFKL